VIRVWIWGGGRSDMFGQARIYVLGTTAILFAGRAILDLIFQTQDQRVVNARLKIRARTSTLEEAVVQLRRKKGLNENGERLIKNAVLGRLIARAGLSFNPIVWLLSAFCFAAAAGMLTFFLQGALTAFLVFAIMLGLGPFGLLIFLGNMREKQLTLQLPDALDTIVRSLHAGHPVPSAVALVGRETPDPLGSEFGLVSDEISYGLSLEEAAEKMALRTEHPDIVLFSAIVRLQVQTGGNLADLLASNAQTIRQRQKMRLKVKAASSEGRMSALILTAAPFAVLLIMYLMSPDFYGEVIDEPIVRWGLGGAVLWMALGNLVMRKMVAFKV